MKNNKHTTIEQIKIVENELNYLEKEGIVIKMPNGKYRIKTQKEIEQEIQNILNN